MNRLFAAALVGLLAAPSLSRAQPAASPTAPKPDATAPAKPAPPATVAPHAAPSSPGTPALPGGPGCPQPCPDAHACPDLCGPRCPTLSGEPCGPDGRFWASAELLLWWVKDAPLPALATTGPATSFGIPGQPGVRPLVGPGTTDFNERWGGRFTAGMWLDCCRTKGIEGGYFFLPQATESQTASGGLLARPFITPAGLPTTELISLPAGLTPVLPGGLLGALRVDSTNRFQGAEINGLCNLCCDSSCGGCGSGRGYRVDAFAGFRWLNLDESLTVSESITVGPGALIFPNSQLSVFDRFETENNFYGGQIGMRGEFWRGRMFLQTRGSIAFGGTEQEVRITGATRLTGPAGTATLPGGLLALPSNIGTYSRNRFAVVPEARINVGYQATDSLRVFVGYTFLYWSSVVRPGDQIDPVVNPALVPTNLGVAPGGPARPAFNFRDTDFWAQGLSLGLELRY